MTFEECEKAQKDQTWLVWEIAMGVMLVRIQTGPMRLTDVYCELHNFLTAPIRQLRVATPNDMLKYDTGYTYLG